MNTKCIRANRPVFAATKARLLAYLYCASAASNAAMLAALASITFLTAVDRPSNRLLTRPGPLQLETQFAAVSRAQAEAFLSALIAFAAKTAEHRQAEVPIAGAHARAHFQLEFVAVGTIVRAAGIAQTAGADLHAAADALTPDLRPTPAVDLAVDIHVIGPESQIRLASVSATERAPNSTGEKPLPPFERLQLTAEARAKAESCLAQAIYHEARGEAVRGQAAVAQVIMNRVFSRHYPSSICGVVYQNAHRLHACQFSFACSEKPKPIDNESAWALAQHIAKLALDGKVWEPEIGKATHYHAVWVNPWWVSTMTRLASHGVHIFYRPTKWGNGSDEPDWNTVTHTAITLAAIN